MVKALNLSSGGPGFVGFVVDCSEFISLAEL